jgi:hypothetical protein
MSCVLKWSVNPISNYPIPWSIVTHIRDNILYDVKVQTRELNFCLYNDRENSRVKDDQHPIVAFQLPTLMINTFTNSMQY